VLLVCSEVDGLLIVTPNNTAVLSGQSAVVDLRCQSDLGATAIGWRRTVVGVADKAIVVACSLRKQFSSVYTVNRNDTTGECDLVIYSVDTSLTGVYTCRGADGQNAKAYLTTIGNCST